MSQPVIMFVIMAILIAVAIVVHHNRQKSERSRLRAWRDVAKERGAAFREPRGALFWSTPAAIEDENDEASVFMDTYIMRNRNSRREFTRVRASLLVPDGPKFRIAPESALATLGKVLGGQDVELGDDEFDDRFVVKTKDVDGTRAMWSDEARDIMRLYFRSGRVTCDGKQVKLTCSGALSVPRRIRAALDLVGELVNVDFFGLEELENLPGARYVKPSGPWDDRTLPCVEIDDVVPIDIGPVLDDRLKAVTRVETEGSVFDDQVHLEVSGDDETKSLESLSLPDGAIAVLKVIGRGVLTVKPGFASFTWRTIATDPRQLLAGVRLIASFGVAPQRGAYR